jgi:mannose/cellobiose epimerase-like protein (N-acyl-D-glucosamine 2-epimerase family)/glycosyltransferase involved in cell wall biosynthesis
MSAVRSEAQALRHWLLEVALPLWWTVGADRERGGFHEAIDLDGRPVAQPHRARSIARMAFVYCEAGRLGWDGPWREAARHALDYLRQHFVTVDATIASIVDLDGRARAAPFDLYDQAFALLAFASAHRAFGETGWRAHAVALRTTLDQSCAHPRGGFYEDRDHRLPQRANPHMHLLEAALAWIAIDPDPGWRRMADGIAALAQEKYMESPSGALREFFAEDWSPAPGAEGRICEPGHHYEWAFLLDRWAKLTGRGKPAAVSALIKYADAHGLDARRGVAINAVLCDGSIHDPVARLWAQAERVRAYVADGRDDRDVAAALQGLQRFLATPKPGLWFDQLTADDHLVIEPARATSLYHIIGAMTELESRSPRTAPANPSSATSSRPPRLIYLVTEDWYFISHRLPMARAARDAGFEVHVATRVDRHGAAITAEGFRLHPISWRRGSLDPRDLVRVVREVRALYRSLAPNLAHHVALPATVVGSLAATGMPIICVNAMTGLGTMFTSDTAKVRVTRAVLTLALRQLLRRSRSIVLVQNRDDRGMIERLGVAGERIALIPGSGVDTGTMLPSPEPAGPITIAFVGRLVESKGIRTLLAAHERLSQRGRDIRLLIAGTPDPANPASIPPQEIEAWTKRPGVAHLGFVTDIAALWTSAHIAVLPSHREGLPLSLLEAAACGRPLIATDVPGCRAIVRPEINGLLVPLEDAAALAAAIDRLAGDGELRRKFAAASRELVEREFSARRIGRDVVELYRRLLAIR